MEDPERALKENVFYKAVGCDTCTNTGYKGRLGIHELMQVTDDVRSVVMKNAPATEIKHIATKNGMITLRGDGTRKVLAGKTSIHEVMRVTADD